MKKRLLLVLFRGRTFKSELLGRGKRLSVNLEELFEAGASYVTSWREPGGTVLLLEIDAALNLVERECSPSHVVELF